MEQAKRFEMTLYTGITNQAMAGLVKNRDQDQAYKHLHRAISAFREVNALGHLAASLADLGHYENNRGSRQSAKDHLKEAVTLYEKIGHLTGPDRIRDSCPI